MLELAILGLLKEQPMHGYELRKQLTGTPGFFWSVSFGSLYPALRKLEQRGLVWAPCAEDGRSRRRRVYRITPAGEALFLELLAGGDTNGGTGGPRGPVWEEEKFPLRLAFFRHLRPEVRIRQLERRKRYLQDRLDVGRAALRRTGRWSDGYTQALVRHGIDTTERDIAWLDGLIAAERRLLEAVPRAERVRDRPPCGPTCTGACGGGTRASPAPGAGTAPPGVRAVDAGTGRAAPTGTPAG